MPGPLSRGLSRAVVPVLWLGTGLTAVGVLRLGWEPGLVSGLFLVAVVTYFLLLERLIPYDRSWSPRGREWGFYGIFFGLSLLGGAVAQFLTTVVVGRVAAPSARGWGLWAEAPAALLISSLAGYTVHRLGHQVSVLWRFHGIHHVPEKVNVANNGVNHIADVTLSQFVVQISLALAGFSAPAVFLIGLVTITQGYFVHANIDVRMGRLNHLLSGPEQHRLHHSADLAEAGHYGSDLSVWDHLFGTFTWYEGRVPVAVGLSDPGSFPSTSEVVASQLHPFRGRWALPGGPPLLIGTWKRKK